MKRSVQEIIELVVFGLIALVVGMLVIWGVGWVFTFLGWLFRIVGAFLWTILKFVIPIAIVAGVVYLLVRLITRRNRGADGAGSSSASSSSAAPASASGTSGSAAQSPTVIENTGQDTPQQAVTQDSADNVQVVETRVDDAEPVDTDVDTSGYKAMDDEAEELEDDSKT